MKTVALIQARFDSSRLPGKVLKMIGDRPALDWVVQAARAIPGVDEVVVATSDDATEDPIADWCGVNGVSCFTGDKDDVLNRLASAAEKFRSDVVLRLTADCPFLDPNVCGQIVYMVKSRKLDYVTNTHPSTWPDGLDCEAMTFSALSKAAAEAVLPSHREHVTLYLRANRSLFRQSVLRCPIPGLNGQRWTLDTADDLDFLDAVAKNLPNDKPAAFTEILSVLDAAPDLRKTEIVSKVDRSSFKNASPDLSSPSYAKRDYSRSAQLLARAEKTIPLGTQTFSKSKLIFPIGKAPLFLSHGLGGRVWDVDGNSYVDYISALLPTLLGNCDPDVDDAIVKQLSSGISFSLATELEAELAERLVDIIPCAEMVRFGKNGTDATSAAVRLARAFTGRDRVAVCGYHGWQDWYIGSTTRQKGVPGAVIELTHKFPFGDLQALEELLAKHRGEFAAVILEPVTFQMPPPGYLEVVKKITHSHNALLVFDEVITGFRMALGGAQEYFGVTPDLAAFGKGLANGMPLSAIVGRAEIMREMEEVFYSGTFGGEALSLAAAIATLDKLQRESVIQKIWEHGNTLAEKVTKLIVRNDLSGVLKLVGWGPWKQLVITPPADVNLLAVRTFLMRHLIDHGVLMSSTHNICYAHNDMTLALSLAAYDASLPVLADVLLRGQLEAELDCDVLQPVFTVRSSSQ